MPITDFYADNTYAPIQSKFFLSPTHSFNSSKNYVIGAAVELNLPFHLSVEADGLYRPLSLTYEYAELLGFGSIAANTDAWEFPIVAKYHFNSRKVKPYIEAGPSFRTIEHPRNRFLSKNGAAIGTGVDLRAFRLHLEPEIRYTYWAPDPPAAAFAHLASHHKLSVPE